MHSGSDTGGTASRAARWSYLPPLMVYLAAGLSGMTGIAGTFFVKDHLGLSAEFIASLLFWATLPWSLKMVFGHAVDLMWRFKSWLVVAGALLVAASLAIMIGLLKDARAMELFMPARFWFVLSSLLGPLGYVLQDVVADAMSVEAVPAADAQGQPLDEARSRSMHTTMQALARGTIICGSVLVSLINLALFRGAGGLPEAQRLEAYVHVYQIALFIPLISVLGVAIAATMREDQGTHAGLRAAGDAPRAHPDPWIIGAGIAFALVSLLLGLTEAPFAELLVFLLSTAIVVFLMRRLLAAIEAPTRHTLVGTAFLIFMFRAVPDPGPAPTWWIIDRLGADESFLSLLSLIGGVAAIAGLFLFRRFMAERSVAFTIAALAIAWTLLSLPSAGMYAWGLHEWTAARTGGLVDGRTIVVGDTSVFSLLSEIAMVPMLAWVARSAPPHLKASYFAVMISFTNLGLSLSRLGSGWLNHVFVVTREVRDPLTGAVQVQADYAQLGSLYFTTIVLALALPLLTIALLRRTRYRSA